MEYTIKPHWNETHASKGVKQVWLSNTLQAALEPVKNGYELHRGWKPVVIVSTLEQAITEIQATGGIN
jgi:hypothetical protein